MLPCLLQLLFLTSDSVPVSSRTEFVFWSLVLLVLRGISKSWWRGKCCPLPSQEQTIEQSQTEWFLLPSVLLQLLRNDPER